MLEEDEADARLQALYRSVSREMPSAAVDMAILGAAQNKIRRDRAAPFFAIAAGLLVAVLVVRDINLPTPGAAPEETRDYLMALHTPVSGDPAESGR
ncbi:MAG: hypothetical protein K1X35_04975 [Caulobacteraceae bacterium]|nr:hypothetical protein [Caulobacteraceae bacterium]